LIEKLKNRIIFFSEFSRLKKAIPKEWHVQLSEEKSVKTTINIKKATGADNIPAKVVRQCKVTVAQQLSSLINLSINTGVFPDSYHMLTICQAIYHEVGSQTPSRDPSIL
jgi:hypothetical protein